MGEFIRGAADLLRTTLGHNTGEARYATYQRNDVPIAIVKELS